MSQSPPYIAVQFETVKRDALLSEHFRHGQPHGPRPYQCEFTGRICHPHLPERL